MRIYNEIVTIFNENTGLWETTSEDSFEYNGPMALMQGTLPNNATAISAQDTIADTIKTTTGYFTANDGTLEGSGIHTGSLSDSNELYYFNITQTNETSIEEVQFAVTFGHIDGSGSNQIGDSETDSNTLVGETKAIYKQFANILLDPYNVEEGFKISQQGSAGAVASDVADEYIYILIGKRARFKDRINKKNWTLRLSGSNFDKHGENLSLTDDSNTTPSVFGPAGPRHNIVSGTLGNVYVGPGGIVSGSSYKTYGWFYPERGVMVFSGPELSASIGGPTTGSDMVAQFAGGYNNSASSAEIAKMEVSASTHISCSGFNPNLSLNSNPRNALRLAICLSNMGSDETAIQMRSEEDASQENFFCRIKANQYNFSANPSFVSGSYNKIRNKDMHGNPSTFITGIGLYNSAGQLLAIASLSKPLIKNFASEATIKVKLTY